MKMEEIKFPLSLRRYCWFFLIGTTILLTIGTNTIAQVNPTDTVNRKRLRQVIIISSATYATTMVGLSQVWYSNFDKQPFSFFNDAKEWMQVDKVGHLYSAFQLAGISARSLKWTGIDQKKSDRIGTVASLIMMSSVEVFDGYSSGYGASTSDLLANALGASLFLGQQLLWNEIRIQPKFSFHTTYLAKLRPEVLGSTFNEKLLKDYNGQTYWLSIDVNKFTPFPKWLNLAVGYGAHEQIFANEESNRSIGLNSYRQLYLSFDFDLASIQTKSKGLKTLLYFINMIKFPAPTLEISKGKVKTHGFYF